MSDQEYTTKPTLETLLEMLREMRDETRAGFARLERIEIRLDRIESMALETRADVRQLRLDVKEHLPAVK